MFCSTPCYVVSFHFFLFPRRLTVVNLQETGTGMKERITGRMKHKCNIRNRLSLFSLSLSFFFTLTLFPLSLSLLFFPSVFSSTNFVLFSLVFFLNTLCRSTTGRIERKTFSWTSLFMVLIISDQLSSSSFFHSLQKRSLPLFLVFFFLILSCAKKGREGKEMDVSNKTEKIRNLSSWSSSSSSTFQFHFVSTLSLFLSFSILSLILLPFSLLPFSRWKTFLPLCTIFFLFSTTCISLPSPFHHFFFLFLPFPSSFFSSTHYYPYTILILFFSFFNSHSHFFPLLCLSLALFNPEPNP